MTRTEAGGSVGDVGESLYEDSTLSLHDRGITIRGYYFPLAAAKRIPYNDVRQVEIRTMNWLTGKGRLWGTANPRYWLALDMRRLAKHTLLCFDLGRRVKPCVSPDDPDRVIELLRGRVPVGEAGGN